MNKKYFIEEIDEENLMEELESGDTGSILEHAQKYCTDFQNLEIIPSTEGQLILKKGNGIMVKSALRYFQILSTQGVLIKYYHVDSCLELSERSLDFYNMLKKDQEKYKIEIIKLTDIKSLEIS